MAFVAFFQLNSCLNKPEKNISDDIMKVYVQDPHSYARPNEAAIEHLKLDIKVDFENKKVSGICDLSYIKSAKAKSIVLDTKSLNIHEITYSDGTVANYQLHEEDPILGAALEITLPHDNQNIRIVYESSNRAEALQWLSPQQTAGKKYPFLFTQSQAILARSWIPLQDSPGVRFTYEARVQVPTGMMALMSAENPQNIQNDGVYHFEMPQPIPSYLMCLAVGNIDFAPVGSRTGVYAEPSVLDEAHEEFNEMDEMLAIAEKLYDEYRWGRYDLLVLPPSFPFGGMENPRITFATPTILAGDKSLVSLVAHELAHSWSGNLVTNATWNDFWLNEGFTVYFEHRIMEALKGKEYADMLSALSLQGLREEVAAFIKSGKSEDTKLKLDLAGRNPDDGVTAIAYDKGYYFLRYLESYVGREKFDDFLKDYFDKFAFKTNYTEAFIPYVQRELFEKNGLEPIPDLKEWIYDTGLPKTLPAVHSTRFAKVDEAVSAWKKGQYQINTSDWSSHEWVYFITQLPEERSSGDLEKLDNMFHFTRSGNAEILGVWFVLVAQNLYEPAFPAMKQFLIHTGRRKFLMPIYTALLKTQKGQALAKEIYAQARPNYHFVAVNSLDVLLR
ncbi:MAG: M1 family metallopeptidase [Cyclobacteriaceae bacterium]|nr:M1 family metallopeptidase [Cyclobacteriaceae bacterium]